ncbi:MAG TPA: nucleotide disphospho-sugar-binding domain-containing protein [Polyangiaceae bacterium]
MDTKRILFVTENVTLAQVVRLVALARELNPHRYEVHFACGSFPAIAFADVNFACWPLPTLDGPDALARLERGQRIYETKVLSRYVEAELELMDRIRPDLVIGDFRLSLGVSTALAKRPLATLINAYWSPFAVRHAFPVPDHPMVKLVGLELATRYFPLAMPKVFAHFAAPVNALRRRHGLPPIGGLLEVLTHGDYTLYPDVEELCPTARLPSTHRYLGAIEWSPRLPLPACLEELDRRLPLVYVTLGSSGKLDALTPVLDALAELPVNGLLATAGRSRPQALPDNVRAAEFVPGALAARAATFVVTNGGSSTGYQALAAGKPVLGVASNLDQYLAMEAIERAGAGVLVRAGSANRTNVREAMQTLLNSREHAARAAEIARSFAEVDCHHRFSKFLDDVF